MPRFLFSLIGFLFIFNVTLADKNENDIEERNQEFNWANQQGDPDRGRPSVVINNVRYENNGSEHPYWPWWFHTRESAPTTTTTTTTTTLPSTTSKPVYVLKKVARKALKNSLRGVAPEKRKKQLKQLGKKIVVEKISKAQSKKLHASQKKVNITQNPPALDMFEVNERAGLNDYLFQGDINLDDSQIASFANEGSSRKKRQIRNSAKFWTNNVVYYYFDSAIGTTMQQIVREAMDYIQTRTCISFKENSTTTNRVKIIDGSGCYSNIGMIGGEQTVSLGSGCELVGIAAHELSHTLGVFHSQMRYDRDDYVTIDLTDVPEDYQSNFVKMTTATSTNLVVYEYGSFMHYSTRAFVSTGGVDSIVPKEAGMVYTMGNRMITFLDIKMLNLHYSCSCPTSLSCKNEGYPNPANCSECICPYGYGGVLCNEKANYTCGSVLDATDTWQQVTYTFGNSSNSAKARPSFIYCNHWIKAPTGKQIQFRIDSAYNTQCGYGCTFNGIEPKLKTDQTTAQIRYCCDEFNGEVMTSEVNPLVVFSYNRYYVTRYTFSYRYVASNTTSCVDVADSSTCTALKAASDAGCAVYDTAQLKVMCAVTMNLCGKTTSTDCADRFSECSSYSANGMCTSQSPLISEFSCAATCGYCDNPV